MSFFLELSRVVLDWISLLDDIWLSHLQTDVTLLDRFKLAAAAVSCFAIRLTVEANKGGKEGLEEAGVFQRCKQLKDLGKKLCPDFVDQLSRMDSLPLEELCQGMFHHVFPMGMYLKSIF